MNIYDISAVIVFAADAVHAKGLENPLNSSFNTIPTFIAGYLKFLLSWRFQSSRFYCCCGIYVYHGAR